jgi:hypothetical protein
MLDNAIMLCMENIPHVSQPTNPEDWAANIAARLRESLGGTAISQ